MWKSVIQNKHRSLESIVRGRLASDGSLASTAKLSFTNDGSLASTETARRAVLGYTIVEVMIFLAISGVMFLLAASFITGKQANVDFRQSLNDINAQIKAVVNEVANGEYDSLVGYDCNAPGASKPHIQRGATNQGANGGTTGCIFLGKVIQFNADGDTTQYYTYTITGRQIDPSTGDPVMSFSAANPIAIDKKAVDSEASVTKTSSLQSGLQVVKIVSCSSNCSAASPVYTAIGSFGFFGSFGGYSAAGGSNNTTGAQSIITAVIPNIAFGQSHSNTVKDLNKASTWSPLDAPANTYVLGGGSIIVLCFTDGARYGSITIGGTNGQQFTTDLQTGNRVPSICTS